LIVLGAASNGVRRDTLLAALVQTPNSVPASDGKTWRGHLVSV
jgi:hypothetical protein